MKKIITLFLFLFSLLIGANEPIDQKENIGFGLVLENRTPLFIGGGVEIRFKEQLRFSAMRGLIPIFYSSILGEAAAMLSGIPTYKTLVKESLHQNIAWKASIDYLFGSKKGWYVGGNFYQFISSGYLPIQDVLEAATGVTFNLLVALLEAQGKSTDIQAKSNYLMGSIQFGYIFELNKHFDIDLNFSVAKILSSSFTFKSEMEGFDNSTLGQDYYKQAEQEIKSILGEYGYIPSLGLALVFNF